MADVLGITGRFTPRDEPVIRVEDRGFQFGDAVYEVFKFLGRGPIFLFEHYRRMERGLAEIEIANPWPGLDDFASMAEALLERTPFEDGIGYGPVSRGVADRSALYAQ